jgi:5'-nucleotidase / UDP-sugar diphosphatase
MKTFQYLSLIALLSCSSDKTDSPDSGADDGKTRVTILHTNDWQSHMLGGGPNAEYTPDSTGDDDTLGGIARIKTLVDELRASTNHPVVLYDAGDWMAGALFQLLATSHASELQMMQAVGYDAITIGNHELDWGPDVLGQMITTADANGVTVPIIASNLHPNPEDAADDALEAHFTSGRIERTRIDTLENGIRVGLFGLVGDSAQSITPAVVPSTFSGMEESGAQAVADLKAEGVDLIVGITHAGVSTDPADSDDALIANSTNGIDVIVGGHSHTPLFEAQKSNGTIIVQAGAYTQYLGELVLVQETSGWSIESYELHEINDSVAGDPEVTTAVDGFIKALNEEQLPALGVSFDTPILQVPGDVVKRHCNESGLGNYITDAFRQQISAIMPEDPIHVAIESQGVIRDDFIAGASGTEAFSDVFRILPLGFGNDDVPGYSLVHFYVTGKELADACEVTASVSPSYGCDYFIEMSGMRCEIDMTRTQFNRVTKSELWNGEEWVNLDTDPANPALYHVAVDSYVASLMGILEDLTFGAIIVPAKDAEGNRYTTIDDMVFDKDPNTEGVQELKLWEALIGYAQTFDDTNGDGVPDLPDRYLGPEGRINGYE